MRSLKRKHKGFILAESVVSLFITLLIASTMAICLGQEYKKIKVYEHRISAHKLMLTNLSSKQVISKQIIKNQKYQFDQEKKKLRVQIDQEVYQIVW